MREQKIACQERQQTSDGSVEYALFHNVDKSQQDLNKLNVGVIRDRYNIVNPLNGVGDHHKQIIKAAYITVWNKRNHQYP